ncbi:MAG: hypothetical protein H0U75_08265 [Legionella sp.]|nr:hypothetical protein [Legionella sp.]
MPNEYLFQETISSYIEALSSQQAELKSQLQLLEEESLTLQRQYNDYSNQSKSLSQEIQQLKFNYDQYEIKIIEQQKSLRTKTEKIFLKDTNLDDTLALSKQVSAYKADIESLDNFRGTLLGILLDKKKKPMAFDLLLAPFNNPFFSALLDLSIQYPGKKIRSFSECFKSKKKLEPVEYDLALNKLIEALKSKLIELEGKINSIVSVQLFNAGINELKKSLATINTTLQEKQDYLTNIHSQMEQNQLKQESIICNTKTMMAKMKTLPGFLDSLKPINDLLAADIQTLGERSSNQVGTIAWANWDSFIKANAERFQSYKPHFSEELEAEFHGFVTVFQQINEGIDEYLSSALETSFIQYNNLLRQVRSIASYPIETAASYDEFRNHYDNIEEQYLKLGENIRTYAKFFTKERYQEKIDTFQKLLLQAKQEQTQLAELVSSNLGAKIAHYMQALVDHTGNVREAQLNLPLLYATPYSLWHFLCMANPELQWSTVQDDMHFFQNALMNQGLTNDRLGFLVTLQQKYSNFFNALTTLPTQDIQNYIRIGDSTSLLDVIESKLNESLHPDLSLQGYHLIIALYEYEQNSKPFSFDENFESDTYSSYSLSLQSRNSMLERLITRDVGCYQSMVDLYAQIQNMEKYILILEQDGRMTDAMTFKSVSGNLKCDLDNFLIEMYIKGPSQQATHNFKRLLHARVYTENEGLGNHFKPGKRILLNILIGLFSGGLALLFKACHSYSNNGAPTLFFDKTHRQELLTKFSETAKATSPALNLGQLT